MSSLFASMIAGAPVRWRTWDAAATEAAERGVPLAIVIGDSLDAWTATWLNAIHADAEVGGLLEQAFVPVAVERLDQPALAALAQQVLAVVADASGVPCLLVLLPGYLPLGALPYAPVRDAEGRKGLARVLLELAEGWAVARDDLLAEATRLRSTLEGLPFALAGGRFVPTLAVDLAEAQLMGEAHTVEGGFGATPDGAVSLPRWPRPEALRFLARRTALPGAAPSLRAHLERSLTALAAGGIRDQLGGGFHRASADAAWNEPLWEQRLGDQARLARAFLDGHQLLGHALFREVAERALGWAIRDLALGDAQWALGRHALSGDFQRWSEAQAAAIVGSDGAGILARRFGLGAEPGALAVRGELEPKEARRLPELVARLSAARCEREPPPLDRRIDPAAHGHLLGALHAIASLPDPQPELVAARDALLARLTAEVPHGRPRETAAIALGLAEAGAREAAGRWLALALQTGRDGLLPWDAGVAWSPIDAEDTVDGPSAAGCAAQALVVLGRQPEAEVMCRQHAGLLMKAPAAACGLCLAMTTDPPNGGLKSAGRAG